MLSLPIIKAMITYSCSLEHLIRSPTVLSSGNDRFQKLTRGPAVSREDLSIGNPDHRLRGSGG